MTPDERLERLQQLWQSHEPLPAPTLDDVRRRSRRLTRVVGWRNLREFVAGAVLMPVLLLEVARGGFDGLIDVGKVLLMGGCAYILYRLYRQGQANVVPDSLGTTDAIAFHRSQLTRQRDLLRSVWRWYVLPFQPGFFVIGLGRAVANPGQWHLAVWTWLGAVGLGVVIAWANRRSATEVQDRIDALDALASGRPPLGERPRRSIDLLTWWGLRALVVATAALLLWNGLGLGTVPSATGLLPQGERRWLLAVTVGLVAVQAARRLVRGRRARR